MRILTSLAALVASAALAACSAAPAAVPTPAGPPTGNVIDVRLTDALRIEPDPIVVPVGVPVTFRVMNVGVADHEFYVGDEAAQAEHGEEMAMGHDMDEDPNGVEVAPGETKELTMTFDAAGETLAGCHEPGHYPGGMKATIRIGS